MPKRIRHILVAIDLVEGARRRVLIQTHAALQALRANPADAQARAQFKAHGGDLGYGLLLLRYTRNPAAATPEQIDRAAWSTVPNVPALWRAG